MGRVAAPRQRHHRDSSQARPRPHDAEGGHLYASTHNEPSGVLQRPREAFTAHVHPLHSDSDASDGEPERGERFMRTSVSGNPFSAQGQTRGVFQTAPGAEPYRTRREYPRTEKKHPDVKFD